MKKFALGTVAVALLLVGVVTGAHAEDRVPINEQDRETSEPLINEKLKERDMSVPLDIQQKKTWAKISVQNNGTEDIRLSVSDGTEDIRFSVPDYRYGSKVIPPGETKEFIYHMLNTGLYSINLWSTGPQPERAEMSGSITVHTSKIPLFELDN
ncbi:hypothetical protein JNUCC42_23320 (plasmid) [Brevibacterium sp. JNUCC-42]|nr:hypothetical protein JNUCC42_23320 [Brevibacterium sp. JNUCC-42]